MTKCYLRWCYCSREEPWSPVQDKQMLVMSMSAGQLLILTLQLDFNPLCKFSSSMLGGHIWMCTKQKNGKSTKGGRELHDEDQRAENHQKHHVTQKPHRMQKCFKMHEIASRYRITHWLYEVMQELSYVQREEPTALWGNHKSIIHQTTRLRTFGLCVRDQFFLTKVRLHYSTDPMEPGGLVFPYTWE